MKALDATGVKQVILCGMEAHVCLYQTALGLLERGYWVFVAADAVSSRAKLNWRNSLENMRLAGAVVASTEMLVFQMTTPLNKDLFKKISSWVK
jgi:isochorismate hydrolase